MQRSSERIALWIRKPEVPGSRLGRYAILSTKLVRVLGRGRISRSGMNLDIKMGFSGWNNDKSILCLCTVTGGCHVLCFRRGIPAWKHIGQSKPITATSRHHRVMTSDVKATLNPNKKQKQKCYMIKHSENNTSL